jgi:8-oxo-dGTP pyrophosphatase MutT (NUDIX family)
MGWLDGYQNNVTVGDGTVERFPAGMSKDEAGAYLYSKYPKEFPNYAPDSGFIAGAKSSFENLKGSIGGIASIVPGALGDQAALDRAGEVYADSDAKSQAALPEGNDWRDIPKAYEEEGLLSAAGETWDFAKTSVGQQVPNLAALYGAGRLGASQTVVKSGLGKAVGAGLSRLAPAIATRVAGAAAAGTVGGPVGTFLGAAFGVASMLPLFFGENLRRQYEEADGEATPEDISLFNAAAAAGPQAASEYVFVGLMGGIGRPAQIAAAQSIKQSLAATTTQAGKAVLGKTVGRTAVESLTEFPTEIVQTILERAQADLPVSLEDAEFVREMQDTIAGTLPVVGVFGGAGAYRSHRANKAAGKQWEKMSESEQRIRTENANRRERARQSELERAEGVQAQNESRWRKANIEARQNRETVNTLAMEEAERAPVAVEDVIEAADSRNILTNSDGFKAFIHRMTGGRTDKLKDTDNTERRRIRSILSGIKYTQEFVEEDGGADMPMFTRAQFDLVVEGTRKTKSAITKDTVRAILSADHPVQMPVDAKSMTTDEFFKRGIVPGLRNTRTDKAIARSLVGALETRGYAARATQKDGTRPLLTREVGYSESQYEEVLNVGQENGRVTQRDVERSTGNYGTEAFQSFINDMRVRGDMPATDRVKGRYVPTTYQDVQETGDGSLAVGNYEVKTEASQGYFVRDKNGDILDGSVERPTALASAKRLRNRSRSYSIKKDGQVIKTLKNSTNAKESMEGMKEADPTARWEVIPNATANITVDTKKSDGHVVNERFMDEGQHKGTLEITFAPDVNTANVARDTRIEEMTPGLSQWEVRTPAQKEIAKQKLEGFLRARGARLDPASRSEFDTVDQDPVTRTSRQIEGTTDPRAQEVLGIMEETLVDAGLSKDIAARVVGGLAATDNAFIDDGKTEGFRYIAINMDSALIRNAKNPAELRSAIAELMNHEMIHAMRELDLFTANEWTALKNSTHRVKMDNGQTFIEWASAAYDGKPGYETQESIEEEAVAEMYRHFHASPKVKKQIAGTPRTLLGRIQQFFEKIANAMSGIGFADASNVIAGMDKIQGRERVQIRSLKDTDRDTQFREFANRQKPSGQDVEETNEEAVKHSIELGRRNDLHNLTEMSDATGQYSGAGQRSAEFIGIPGDIQNSEHTRKFSIDANRSNESDFRLTNQDVVAPIITAMSKNANEAVERLNDKDEVNSVFNDTFGKVDGLPEYIHEVRATFNSVLHGDYVSEATLADPNEANSLVEKLVVDASHFQSRSTVALDSRVPAIVPVGTANAMGEVRGRSPSEFFLGFGAGDTHRGHVDYLNDLFVNWDNTTRGKNPTMALPQAKFRSANGEKLEESGMIVLPSLIQPDIRQGVIRFIDFTKISNWHEEDSGMAFPLSYGQMTSLSDLGEYLRVSNRGDPLSPIELSMIHSRYVIAFTGKLKQLASKGVWQLPRQLSNDIYHKYWDIRNRSIDTDAGAGSLPNMIYEATKMDGAVRDSRKYKMLNELNEIHDILYTQHEGVTWKPDTYGHLDTYRLPSFVERPGNMAFAGLLKAGFEHSATPNKLRVVRGSPLSRAVSDVSRPGDREVIFSRLNEESWDDILDVLEESEGRTFTIDSMMEGSTKPNLGADTFFNGIVYVIEEGDGKIVPDVSGEYSPEAGVFTAGEYEVVETRVYRSLKDGLQAFFDLYSDIERGTNLALGFGEASNMMSPLFGKDSSVPNSHLFDMVNPGYSASLSHGGATLALISKQTKYLALATVMVKDQIILPDSVSNKFVIRDKADNDYSYTSSSYDGYDGTNAGWPLIESVMNIAKLSETDQEAMSILNNFNFAFGASVSSSSTFSDISSAFGMTQLDIRGLKGGALNSANNMLDGTNDEIGTGVAPRVLFVKGAIQKIRQVSDEMQTTDGAYVVDQASSRAAHPSITGKFDQNRKKSVTNVDEDAWEQIGPQGGSNSGGMYRNVNTGEQLYVKTSPNIDMSRNEILASKIYALAGVEAADANPAIRNGEFSVASSYVDGLSEDPNLLKGGRVPGAQEHMAVDAWLGNWDVVGATYDNMLVKDGRAVRIDPGGSMAYRAQGGLKNEQIPGSWGPTVEDIQSLLKESPTRTAWTVFDKTTDEDLIDGYSRILEIPTDVLRETVQDYGPVDPDANQDAFDMLEARRRDIEHKQEVLTGAPARKMSISVDQAHASFLSTIETAEKEVIDRSMYDTKPTAKNALRIFEIDRTKIVRAAFQDLLNSARSINLDTPKLLPFDEKKAIKIANRLKAQAEKLGLSSKPPLGIGWTKGPRGGDRPQSGITARKAANTRRRKGEDPTARTVDPSLAARYKDTIKYSVADVDGPEYQETGGQKGSNDGGQYTNVRTGEVSYVKTYDDTGQARAEILASKIYQLAGVEVAEYSPAKRNGEFSVISPWVDGLYQDERALTTGRVPGVQENFGVDAWLGNYDVIGLVHDNLALKDGRGFRHDFGGVFEFRASGGRKSEIDVAQWGPVVNDIEAMRDPDTGREAVDVMDKVTDQDLISAYERILEIPSDVLMEAVKLYGPVNPTENQSLVNMLEQRRDDISNRLDRLQGNRSNPPIDYNALQWANKGNRNGRGKTRDETAQVKSLHAPSALVKIMESTNIKGRNRDLLVAQNLTNFTADPTFDVSLRVPVEWGEIGDGNVSVGVAVRDTNGNIILREVKNHFDGYHWSFAKGRRDKGETYIEAALRELEEETGLSLDTPGLKIVGALPGGYASGNSDTYFYVAEIEVDYEPHTRSATPGRVPLIPDRPARNARQDIMEEISKPIARGEIPGRKMSVADGDTVQRGVDPADRKGNRTLDELRAEVVPPAAHKSMWDTIMSVVGGETKTLSWFKQKFVDKYEGIRLVVEKAQKLKGDDRSLLAGVNALKAAYLSDKSRGIVEEAITSGRVVYENGMVRVDNNHKGLMDILSPLFSERGDLLRDWHLYMIAKREGRFEREGRMVQMSADERATVMNGVVDNGWSELFTSVSNDYREWNDATVNFMIDTGVLTKDMGEIYKKYGDYIPFYREFDGDASERLVKGMQDLVGDELALMESQGRRPLRDGKERARTPTSMFQSLTGAKPGKAAKGGTGMVVDPLVGIMKNLEAAVTNGMKNIAAQRVMADAVTVNMAEVVENKSQSSHTIRVNGEDVHYAVYDELLHDSLTGMVDGHIKYLNFFAAPATFLREMVTRSPDFIMANLMRDSLSVWATAGDTKPIIDTMTNFFAGENEAYNQLKSSGLITGFDNGRNAGDFSKKFGSRLRQAGLAPGKGISFWGATKKVWDWSGGVTTKSDAATRQAVYESVLTDMLSKGFTRAEAEGEAIYQGMEVINFSRRGNSALAKVITATVPFLNARVQGLDLLWRAGRGRYSTKIDEQARSRALIGFLSRLGFLATTSILYAGMMADEEEYKNARPEQRDDNWILPSFGGMPSFKIPIPFEVGVIAKTIPERLFMYYHGKQDTRQTVDALTRAFTQTLEINPIPQFYKPLGEVMSNHSAYSNRQIIPWYLERLKPELQKRPKTNELATTIGEVFNVSPLNVEHLLRGYTGTLGSYALVVADHVTRSAKGIPARPTLRTDQVIIGRRFLQSNEGADGQVADWYQFREAARGVLQTFTNLQEEGTREAAIAYAEKNKGTLGLKNVINSIDNKMQDLRKMEKFIILDQTMSAPEKAEKIKRIDGYRKQLLSSMPEIRQQADLPVKLPFPLSAFNG